MLNIPTAKTNKNATREGLPTHKPSRIYRVHVVHRQTYEFFHYQDPAHLGASATRKTVNCLGICQNAPLFSTKVFGHLHVFISPYL